MIVDLSQVANVEGAHVKFSGEADLSEATDLTDGIEFIAPVSVCGTVSNLGGDIELKAHAEGRARLVCDRCLDEFEQNVTAEIFERLAKEGAADADGDIVEFSGSAIDIDRILVESFIVDLPTKTLCREDCKGLCASCGKNLNEGDCGCSEPVDPRFDILDSLTFDE